jgi:purine-nucleoside phosphorylase
MKKKNLRITMKKKHDTVESRVKESVEFIREQSPLRPKIALILGSGLGEFADLLTDKIVIPTSTIPHYPQSTVEGHKGNLVLGKLQHITLLAFQGRVHFYETGKLETILYPIRVAHGLHIKKMIVTNAAGGVNTSFIPGDLMLIEDQINLTFEHLGEAMQPTRKCDLYDLEIRKIIDQAAREKNIPIKKGVYCGIKGPSYETAAEVAMLRKFGADAVGMSTVNEVSLASVLGMKIGGISCITNLSTGILDQKLSHAEVTEIADKVKGSFSSLLQGIIHLLSKNI